MRNIRLELAFVGTAYSGWQRQRNGLAIQEVIERAAGEITGSPTSVTGCSRTDAGVHAEQYFANFRTESDIQADRFAPAISSRLPRDILIRSSREVAYDFNARKSAIEKRYRYQIYLARSPFYEDRWWQFGHCYYRILTDSCVDISGFS
jgi:tRNA pseudouridine38-40 synthase